MLVVIFSRFVGIIVGMAANPARQGQLTKKNIFSRAVPVARDNLGSWDKFGRPVPRHSRNSSLLPDWIWCLLSCPSLSSSFKWCTLIAIGSAASSLSCHANTLRWRSLPRVHRHRASSSSSRGSSNKGSDRSQYVRRKQFACTSSAR